MASAVCHAVDSCPILTYKSATHHLIAAACSSKSQYVGSRPTHRGVQALGSEFYGFQTVAISRTRFCSRERRARGVSSRVSLEEFAPLTAAVYGTSLLGGGLYAYARTGSTGSLGGGITGFFALGLAFILMQNPETGDIGEALAFGAALIFASLFGIRLVATRKPVPAGPLLALSATASFIFARAYFQASL